MSRRKAIQRFFVTPKGLLTIVFAVLLATAGRAEGWHTVAPVVAAAVITGAVIDIPILWWRKKKWEFPSGAVLTGLIVAMVLSQHEPWYVVATTSAVAILSKYIVRTRSANIFNPAAAAMVATFYVFNTGQS